MPNDTQSAPVQTISLKALRLRPGQSIQTQSTATGAPKEEAQFLAAIENKGIMVGPFRSGLTISLEADTDYTISGFTGMHDFSFAARALQVFEKPFSYALLAYPEAVDARQVRRAMRLKTSHPATVNMPGLSEAMAVTLVDVSHCGAMVRSPAPLGVVGNTLSLCISIAFEGELVDLNIPATICHSNKNNQSEDINVGLAFKPMTTNDKLLLYFLEQSSND